MISTERAVLAGLLLAALTALPLPARAQSAAGLIQQSDDLYAERADLTKAKAALAKLEEALAAKEDAFSVYWRLSRVSYWIGDHTAGNDANVPLSATGLPALLIPTTVT